MLRALAVLAAGLLAVLLSAPAAGAHAVLLDSDPPDGATVAQAPHSIRLRFTEDISATFRSAQLIDADGGIVAGAQLRRADDPRDLVLDLPSLPAGGYGVLWRVLAQSDGHTSSGGSSASGAAPASVPAATAAPRRADPLAGAAPRPSRSTSCGAGSASACSPAYQRVGAGGAELPPKSARATGRGRWARRSAPGSDASWPSSGRAMAGAAVGVTAAASGGAAVAFAHTPAVPWPCSPAADGAICGSCTRPA